jgi:hypothetical protein
MKRRDFVVASGSAILSGYLIDNSNKPVFGAKFELTSENADPAKTQSVLLKFNRLRITPQYLDDNENLQVRVIVKFEDGTKKIKTADQISFENGQKIGLQEIQSRSSVDLSSILVDGISTSKSIFEGNVTIEVSHPQTGKKDYNRRIQLSETSTIVDDFEDGNLSEYSVVDSGTTSTIKVQSNTYYTGNNALQMTDSSGTPAVASMSGLESYPKAGDTFSYHWYYTGSNAVGALIFGAQSEGDFPDGYMVRPNQSDGFEFQELGGSLSISKNFNRSSYTNQWLRTTIDWKEDGKFVIDLDKSDGTNILTLEPSSTKYKSGGINWTKGSGSSTTETVFFDNLKIIG